jgi:hypothetical protein
MQLGTANVRAWGGLMGLHVFLRTADGLYQNAAFTSSMPGRQSNTLGTAIVRVWA